MQNIRLSVVIITFNEERNIARCLDSVQGVADEIIVIDSFSSDQTEAICLRYPNLRFIRRAWTKHYADAKNAAADAASGDYVLSLDADEALSDELKRSMMKMKQQPDFDIFMIHRLTNYCGQWIRHCGWYPEKLIRIWKKDAARWQGKVHETLLLHSPKIGFLKGDLLHYSFYSVSDHLQKIAYYTDLMAQQEIEKGKKASFLKLYLSPLFKFLKSYFMQLGFLDGYQGFVICWLSGVATFAKYVKVRELEKNKKNLHH
jgi:glycosyltransferase involved in cell wall biosynthesis